MEEISLLKLKRRFATLIEMMVVLAILGLAAGFVGINVSKAITEQGFRTDASVVVDYLRFAQNLMLIMDEDVEVIFAKDSKDGVLRFWLNFECPLGKQWNKMLNRKPAALKNIKWVSLSGSSSDESTEQKQVVLKFLSRGTVMTRGILELVGKNMTRSILLSGSPQPIFFSSATEANFLVEESERSSQGKLLTEHLVSDIHAKYGKPST